MKVLCFALVVLFAGPAVAQSEIVEFSVATPRGVYHNDIPVGALDSLDIRDAVTIEAMRDGEIVAGAAVNTGTGETVLGSSSITGTLSGNGSVFVRGSAIRGDVVVGGNLTTQQDSVIEGRTISGGFDVSTTTWLVEFPQNVNPAPPGSGTLLPDAYGQVSVGSNQTLTLYPGVYTFQSFRMEPQSQLILDNTDGDIFVYIRGEEVALRGSIQRTDPAIYNVLWGYAGTQRVTIEARFDGHFVAPFATLSLSNPVQRFSGAYWGRRVEIHAQAVVTHIPFSRSDCTRAETECTSDWACILEDSDLDTIPDCEEERDGDPWTSANVPNGVVSSLHQGCFSINPDLCDAVSERAQVQACLNQPLDETLSSGLWSFRSATPPLCPVDFGFSPDALACELPLMTWSEGFIRLAEGHHCFGVSGLSSTAPPDQDACTALFFGDALFGTSAEQQVSCVSVPEGAYPIEWVFAGFPDRVGEPRIRYCFGGDTDCAPSGLLPPRLLRPNACGVLESCSESCPCEDNAECTSDANCAAGEVCPDEPNGALFDRWPDLRLCVDPSCPVGDPDCAQGSPAQAPTRCESDTECTDGATCQEVGAAFGDLSSAKYCWNDVCDSSDGHLYCGTFDALCGACICTPSCEGKACGDDAGDGCGGYCGALCGDGQQGCVRDLDCQQDAVCAAGRCVPTSCYTEACDPAACGAECVPLCRRDCGERECGMDANCGVSCGTCGDGKSCVSGRCLAGLGTLPGVPDALVNEQPTSAIGTLAGSVSVSEAGSPVYDLPLELPAGRGGTKPKLSLTYLGGAQTGNAGVGWTIGHSSTITRCAKTAAVDGTVSAPQGTADDAFCLDGQRLVLVSGQPGESESEYRTEVESFRRAVFIAGGGGVDDDPDYWAVQDRDGTTWHYGRAGVVPGTDFQVTSHWLLTSEVNRSGAVTRYYYNRGSHETECEPPKNSEFGSVSADGYGPRWGRAVARNCVTTEASFLSSIAYGGTADELGSHWVRIKYEPSGQVLSSYNTTGIERVTAVRASAVEVGYADQNLRRYELDYATVGGRPGFLSSVSECAYEQDGDEVCLPATRFTYNAHPDAPAGDIRPFVATPEDDELTYKPIGQRLWIDANGDGLKDLLYQGYAEIKQWALSYGVYSQEEVLTSSAPIGTANDCFGPAGLRDLDGNGMTDLLESCPSDNEVYAWFATGDSEQPFIRERIAVGPSDQVFLADFDGSGYPQLVECNDQELRVYAWPDAIPFEAEFQYAVALPGSASCNWERDPKRQYPVPMLLDLERSGATRLYVREPTLGGQVFSLNPTTHEWEAAADFESQSQSSRSTFRANYGAIKLLDTNGDGMLELVENSVYVTIAEPGPIRRGRTRFRTSSSELSTFVWRNRGLRAWDFQPFAPTDETGAAVDIDRETFDALSVLDHDRNGSEELVGFTRATSSSFRLRIYEEQSEGEWRVKDLPDFSISEDYLTTPETPPSFGDLNGDGADDLLLQDGKNVRVHYGAAPDRYLLNDVKDGLGNRIHLTYDLDGSQYTAGRCRSDSICIPRVGPVVETLEFFDAAGAKSQTVSFKYQDAQRGLYGRGWLGYGEREVTTVDGAGELIKRSRTVFDNGSKPELIDDPESERSSTFDETHKNYFFAGIPLLEEEIGPEVNSGFDTSPDGASRTTFIFRRILAPTTRLSDANRPFVIPSTTSRSLIQGLADGTQGEVTGEYESFRDEGPTIDQYGNVLRRFIARNTEGVGLDNEVITNEYFAPTPVGWNPSLLRRQVRRSERGGEARETVTEFDYDTYARLAYVVRDPGDATQEAASHYTYDDYGNVAVEQQFNADLSLFRETVYGYDAQGLRLQSVTNPLGMTWLYSVDPATGAALVEVDPNGVATRHAYDAFLRRTATESPIGRQEISVEAASEFGATYRVIQTTSDPVAAKTHIQYHDSLGRTLAEQATGLGGQPIEQLFTYDARGRLSSATLPGPVGGAEPLSTSYTYDELGMVRSITAPDATGELSETRYEYATRLTAPEYVDAARPAFSFVSRQTDVENVSTLTFRNGLGLVTHAESAGNFESFAYDGNYQVVEHTTNSNVQTYIRNNYGQVLETTDRDLGTVAFDYDAFGQLRTVTHADNSATGYVHDALGRVTNVLGTTGTTAYFYDRDIVGESEGELPLQNALGQPVRIEHLEGAVRTIQRFRYLASTGNPLTNRALMEEASVTTRGRTLRSAYEYLPGTARVNVQHYPSRSGTPFAVQQCYDAFGDVSHVVAAQSGSDASDCESASGAAVYWRRGAVLNGLLPTSSEYGNGVVAAHQYNAANYALEGISITATNGGIDFSYGYKPGGRLSQESRQGNFGPTPPPSQLAGDYQRSYTYADSGLLELVKDSATDENIYDPVYTPELRLQQLEGAVSTLAGPYTYELTADGVASNRPSDIGDNHFDYDGRGNQTRRAGPDIAGGLQVIEYNDFNLPSRIITGIDDDAQVTAFGYDGQGTRVYRENEHQFAWHLGGIYEHTQSVDEVVNVPVQESEHFWVFAEGRRVAQRTVDYVLGEIQSDTTQYVHTDRLGSTVAVTDSSGAVTAEVTYGLYGQLEQELPVAYGYTGHRHEAALGLIDAGGRFYDPVFGIFLSVDPIGPLFGSSPRGNRYAYVGYDSINYIDPTGYFWREVISFVGGVVAGVVCTALTQNPAIGVGCGLVAGAAISGTWTAVEGGTGSQILNSVIEGAIYGAAGGSLGSLAVVGVKGLIAGSATWGSYESIAGATALTNAKPLENRFNYDESSDQASQDRADYYNSRPPTAPVERRSPSAKEKSSKVKQGETSPGGAAYWGRTGRLTPVQDSGRPVIFPGDDCPAEDGQCSMLLPVLPAFGDLARAAVSVWSWVFGESSTAASAASVAARGGARLTWGFWKDLPKVVEGGRTYAQIGQRLYTEHAVQRMLPAAMGGRGVAPAFVEAAIETGVQTTQVVGGVTRTIFTSGNVQVVTEQAGRLVVTVMRVSTP